MDVLPGASSERPLVFDCEGDCLVGMLHLPAEAPQLGLVLVVGGPQYRVGSHRQFLLLARHLAKGGVAVLRFDCRGMGDSTGDFPGFEAIGADIAAAAAALRQEVPSLTRMALWGLCDAASAICLHAHEIPRIDGVALLNPWVRSDSGEARTYIRHYYRQRLFDAGFWSKLLAGDFRFRPALASFWGMLRRASGKGAAASGESGDDLAERMARGLEGFPGPVLLVTSGRDLTAREFEDAAVRSRRWRRILAGKSVARHGLAESDHTFSRRLWRDQVAEWTAVWLTKSFPVVATERPRQE